MAVTQTTRKFFLNPPPSQQSISDLRVESPTAEGKCASSSAATIVRGGWGLRVRGNKWVWERGKGVKKEGTTTKIWFASSSVMHYLSSLLISSWSNLSTFWDLRVGGLWFFFWIWGGWVIVNMFSFSFSFPFFPNFLEIFWRTYEDEGIWCMKKIK